MKHFKDEWTKKLNFLHVLDVLHAHLVSSSTAPCCCLSVTGTYGVGCKAGVVDISNSNCMRSQSHVNDWLSACGAILWEPDVTIFGWEGGASVPCPDWIWCPEAKPPLRSVLLTRSGTIFSNRNIMLHGNKTTRKLSWMNRETWSRRGFTLSCRCRPSADLWNVFLQVWAELNFVWANEFLTAAKWGEES